MTTQLSRDARDAFPPALQAWLESPAAAFAHDHQQEDREAGIRLEIHGIPGGRAEVSPLAKYPCECGGLWEIDFSLLEGEWIAVHTGDKYEGYYAAYLPEGVDHAHLEIWLKQQHALAHEFSAVGFQIAPLLVSA